jgi:ribosomal-protein-alanine acetyltransferase
MAQSALNPEPVVVRRARNADLAGVAAIQSASPEAAQWDPTDYLAHDFIVATWGGQIAGYAVARQLTEGEAELLNLAVDRAYRRRGIGRRLLQEITFRYKGTIWLEVRESNRAARNLYKSLGFCESGRRRKYYRDSGEGAIVMNFHSC